MINIRCGFFVYFGHFWRKVAKLKRVLGVFVHLSPFTPYSDSFFDFAIRKVFVFSDSAPMYVSSYTQNVKCKYKIKDICHSVLAHIFNPPLHDFVWISKEYTEFCKLRCLLWQVLESFSECWLSSTTIYRTKYKGERGTFVLRIVLCFVFFLNL